MLRLQAVGAVINMMTTALLSRKSLYFYVVVIAIAFAKFGKIGITIPKPKRSMKIVKNNVAIRLSFILRISF